MKYTVPRNAMGFFMVSLIVLIWPVQAQESDQGSGIPNTQVQIAISSPSYPVTSGDVY